MVLVKPEGVACGLSLSPTQPPCPYQLGRLSMMRHRLPNLSQDWAVVTGMSSQHRVRGTCVPDLWHHPLKTAGGHRDMGLELLSLSSSAPCRDRKRMSSIWNCPSLTPFLTHLPLAIQKAALGAKFLSGNRAAGTPQYSSSGSPFFLLCLLVSKPPAILGAETESAFPGKGHAAIPHTHTHARALSFTHTHSFARIHS